MLNREVARGPRGAIVLMDTITALAAGHAGAIVVTGSHGGTSAATFATAVALKLVVFNDAGVGKDGAGISALAMLGVQGIAAATVAHTSARIGDAQDAWNCGVISHVNALAAQLGLAPGRALQGALRALIERQ